MNYCVICGVGFIPSNYHPHQKFCSEKHRDCFYHKNERGPKGYRTKKEIEIRKKINCRNCGTLFTPTKKHLTYCSDECKPKKSHPSITRCVVCGNEFVHNLISKKTCSKECRILYARLRSRDRDKRFDLKRKSPRVFKCKECGEEFMIQYPNKQRIFCSLKCSTKYGRRIGKLTRRARIIGAKHIEYFNPIYVFKRDNWHCQLCGVRTPKRLRGTINDDAPELDHIIPLSLGGEHTIANTQCLCRKCNQDKGASIAGQLRFA